MQEVAVAQDYNRGDALALVRREPYLDGVSSAKTSCTNLKNFSGCDGYSETPPALELKLEKAFDRFGAPPTVDSDAGRAGATYMASRFAVRRSFDRLERPRQIERPLADESLGARAR
jgi:hypothetical protein